ncbi:MAG: hypothetical protein CM15mP12_1300 [Gammaproteobacteria bacterium]|nr:MAG: hypothetical protein CM15mP12_1300 [Gammaproteobacteria bacterium]
MDSEKDAKNLIDPKGETFQKEISDKNVMTTQSAFEMLDQEKVNKLRIIGNLTLLEQVKQ